MKAMKSLRFDNAALRSLPVDPSTKNVPRQVSACYSRVEPTPVENPKIIAASDSALRLIGLDKETVLADQDYAEYFSGNKLFQGSEPAAHCYSGHQFGSFAGQLGDGRAISLGEVVNDSRQRWELQLKGAGKTPFSRFADGRAVLRSSIREYLCSEHMAALGVPSTRAGTLVLSTTLATRDPQYNGRQILEKCAIVSRIAPTFLRFGSWEVFKPRDFDEAPTNQNKAVGNQMLNHAVEHFFPEIHEEFKQPAATGELQTQKALKFYEEIVRRTARMVAEWQLVGFTHGVLNTDNMSILGVTIDYGPFGFLDKYNPHFTPNTTDESGRYRFEAQPQICKWNLIKFAEALEFGECLPYKLAEKSLLSLFDSTFHEAYWGKLRNKLGLHAEDPDDQNLCEAFFATLRKTNGDFTNSFRILSRVAGSGDFPEEVLDYLVKQSGTVEDAVRSVPVIYTSEQIQSLKLLKERSPQTFEIITGGNEHVIAEAEEMLKAVAELRKMDPAQKKEQDRTLWRAWLVRYKERVGKETLPEEKRREMMNSANPKYILRNYLLQNAIAEAEKGDYSGVHRLEKVMLRPFEEWEGEEDLGVNGEVPVWACNYVLSCSS